MSLFIKECKQLSKSIIYFVFVGVVILFYVTQLGAFAWDDIKLAESNAKYSVINPLMKPPLDAESYGTKEAEIPEQIMPKAISYLVMEYSSNSYTAYPIGFHKNVKLNEKERLTIAEIITEITGSTPSELEEKANEYNEQMSNAYLNGTEIPQLELIFPIVVSYDTFKEKMAEVDEIIGGGSSYSVRNLLSYGQEPVTYEEKLLEYNAFISDDKITGAYARLFCDYMGIVVALFSVFVPVAFLMSDKKSHMNELIYSRKKSSIGLVVSRYFAVVFMSILPVLVLSIIPTFQLVSYGIRANITVDVLAFIKYIMAWIMPTLMTTTAVGFFLTILTDTPIAIAIQFFWSFLTLNGSVVRIRGGNYGYELFIRHNTLSNLQVVKDGFNAIVFNRVAYAVLALVLVAITAFIYEQKRRGRLDVNSSIQKIFRRNKGAN